MLRLARQRVAVVSNTVRHNSSRTTEKQHDPLRILFCGADEFSIYSLRTLRTFQDARPDKIASIDVLCRPDKRVGRGLKQIQPVPIKGVANELDLHLHQIDTFKGWQPPSSINLVVAVSFGLLVPARILHGAKYGGLNVHPSMLPDLRGPAPMIHTLLKRRSNTGVTLQTMHPTKFDEGNILDQTPAPGFSIAPGCTPEQLLHQMGPQGAQMLLRAVEHGLFVTPIQDFRREATKAQQLDYAPKVTPEDRHIDWQAWSADEIVLRDRVLGRLWDNGTYSRCLFKSSSKRITFHGPWTSQRHLQRSTAPGEPSLVRGEDKKLKLGIATIDDQLITPAAATIEGGRKGEGLKALIDGLRAT